MAQWVVQKETPPGSGIFVEVTSVPVQPTGPSESVTEIAGYQVYQDGYPDDFSGWGDDESMVLITYLWACSAADGGVSYAAMWVGNYPDLSGQQMRAAAVATPPKPPTRLIVVSAKHGPKPKRHGH
jgi:hypothetical protein